jgi:BON domain
MERAERRTARSDHALRDAVWSELACDSALDAAGLDVVVAGGTVTVTGSVGSYPERVAAVRAVERVYGISGVVDEIQVDHSRAHNGGAWGSRAGTSASTAEDRLADLQGRVARLQERAAAGTDAARSRMQYQIDEVRKHEESTRLVVHQAADEADVPLRRLDTRVAVAEHAIAVELADGRETLERAVDSMLHACDLAIERLQAKAATGSVDARGAAEAAISDLRTRRNDIAASIATARSDVGDTWRQRKRHVVASADRLCRQIDELSEKVEDGGAR